MSQWNDLGHCPRHQDLDALNDLFRPSCLHRSTRDYTKNWICPTCRSLYKPCRNLLGDLPPFGCPRCRVENTECYEWSMSQVMINYVHVDAMIYNQGQTKYCALYAVTAAVDLARRLKGAFHFIWESAPFHVEEMLTKYKMCTGVELAEEPCHVLFGSYDNIPLILRTFKQFGIGYLLGTYFDRMAFSAVPRLHIDHFFRVDERDVFLVTRLISSGYPLVTSFVLGQLFSLSNKGQVYLPPHPYGGDELGGHAIALTGSGKAANPSKGGAVETFYAGRNSHGPIAHSDYHKQNFGGDFLLFASDARFIWGFTLKPELPQYAPGPWPHMAPVPLPPRPARLPWPSPYGSVPLP